LGHFRGGGTAHKRWT